MGTHVLEEYRPNNYTCAVCPYTCIQNTHRYIEYYACPKYRTFYLAQSSK